MTDSTSAVFERADRMLVIVDGDRRIGDVNPALADALARSREQVRGALLLDLVHESERSAIASRLDELGDWVHAVQFECRVALGTGGYRWLDWTMWRDPAGPGLRGVARDISEQRQRSIEEHLFFELSLDMLALATTGGYFARVNPAFTATLGWSRDDLQTQPFVHWIHPDDIDSTVAEVAKLAQGGKTIRFENRYRTKHGGYKWISWTANPDPATGQLYAVARDVTQVKQFEHELHRAKVAAETASRAKSEFLANMSHELRTPLNAVLGYAQLLLRDESLTARDHEAITVIQQSGEHLLLLISDILDLAKIESGKLSLIPKEFHFGDFLKVITDMFEIRAREKSLSFITHLPPDLPIAIRCDETRLRQVLINLLSNAIKFTHHGGVTLTIARRDDRLWFQIKDTGVGIAESELDAIFRPFEQSRRTRNYTEGTGLGLPISKQLVDMMGGRLAVTSAVGEGSTFSFDFALDVPETWTRRASDQRAIIGYEGARKKILIADDKHANRAVLSDLLTSVGFDVIHATDGDDAIERARTDSPDLIIMDLVMPTLDGFEATRRIRQIDELQKIPIIASSASVFEEDQQRSRAVGCDGFVSKPIDAKVMFQVVGHHLDLSWRYRTGPSPDEPLAAQSDAPDVEPDSRPDDLSRDELRALRDAARIGDVRAILTVLQPDGQPTHAPAASPLRQRLHALAKGFQVKQIKQIMETMLDDE